MNEIVTLLPLRHEEIVTLLPLRHEKGCVQQVRLSASEVQDASHHHCECVSVLLTLPLTKLTVTQVHKFILQQQMRIYPKVCFSALLPPLL